MNLYATLGDVKSDLGISGTAQDATLLRYLEGVSRSVERFCKGRRFWTESASRFQTAHSSLRVRLDEDLLSVSELVVDTEQDGTYDGETWVEDTHFWLHEFNAVVRSSIEAIPYGSKSFLMARRAVKVTGVWGYGDGMNVSPWGATAFTGTLTDGTDTTLTLDVDPAGAIDAGHTVLIEDEQVYVSSITTVEATVKRGVNGTAAVAHSSKAVSVALYPEDVRRFVAWMTGWEFKQRGTQGMAQEKIGDYFYSRMVGDVEEHELRVLGVLRRGVL